MKKNDTKINFQVGIISFPLLECVLGSGYIRVSAFYNWILDKTSDAKYCLNPFWPMKTEEETIRIKSTASTSKDLLITEVSNYALKVQILKINLYLTILILLIINIFLLKLFI